MRETRFINGPAEPLPQNYSYSLQTAIPAQSVIGGNARRGSTMRSRSEGIFRKAAFFFLWLLIFVIPWENAVVIPGFGTLSRAVGIPAFGMALLAILESGTLRTLSMQHLIVLFFTAWAGLTYFWSFAPSATVAAIFTFAQIFTMLWLIWEFAQTSEQQILLLRAYMLGAMISSVATLENFSTTTSVYGSRYTGLNFNPGDLGFIEALSIPIALYLAVRERKKDTGMAGWFCNRAGILRNYPDSGARRARRLCTCGPNVPIFVPKGEVGPKSCRADVRCAGRNWVLAFHAGKLMVAAFHDWKRNKLRHSERKDLDLADRMAGVRTGSLPGRRRGSLCTDG